MKQVHYRNINNHTLLKTLGRPRLLYNTSGCCLFDILPISIQFSKCNLIYLKFVRFFSMYGVIYCYTPNSLFIVDNNHNSICIVTYYCQPSVQFIFNLPFSHQILPYNLAKLRSKEKTLKFVFIWQLFLKQKYTGHCYCNTYKRY